MDYLVIMSYDMEYFFNWDKFHEEMGDVALEAKSKFDIEIMWSMGVDPPYLDLLNPKKIKHVLSLRGFKWIPYYALSIKGNEKEVRDGTQYIVSKLKKYGLPKGGSIPFSNLREWWRGRKIFKSVLEIYKNQTNSEASRGI